jgi:hypothetical protein
MDQDLSRQYAHIVAKCWADPAFKAKLMANTNATLAAEGVDVPAGIEVRVVENSANVVYVALPARPADGELQDEDLAAVVGAANACACASVGVLGI